MYTSLFHYALWRKDISIKEIDYNDIDYLILTLLSYLRFSILTNITLPLSLSSLFSYYKKTNHEYDEVYELFHMISSSKRYSHIQILDFQCEEDPVIYKQFFALTYLLENKTLFIVFRGTDDSWVGWKENITLLYEKSIPSHAASLHYIYHIINTKTAPFNRFQFFNKLYNYFHPYKLIIAGHSKGGHLALYSSFHLASSIQKHIVRIINFDGPGLLLSMLEKRNYEHILSKTITYVPTFSFFGLLFYHEENFKVIHSTTQGLNQHDPMSWCVSPMGLIEDELKDESIAFFIKMNTFLNTMTNEEKKEVFSSLFELFTNLNIYSFNDIYHLKFKHLILSLNTLTHMNSYIRKKLIIILKLIYFDTGKL